MKNLKIIIVSLLLLGFLACDKDDANINTVFDSENGQTGIGFASTSQSRFIVPVEGITKTINIESTTTSDVARTFNVSVDESSTALPVDYTIGTLSIPANSFIGTLDVTFNYDNLVDFQTNTLVLNLDLPEGVVAIKPTTVFTFVKYFDITTYVCDGSSYNLKIVTDDYGSETSWEITNDSGTIVQTGGPYSDGTAGQAVSIPLINLSAGCYTFTIYDSFGDGLFDGNTTGTYDLTCAAEEAVSYASGSGNFGSSESTDFCVN